MPRIVAEDFTFVTNNARDFRKLYGEQAVHAGLIIIVPQAIPGMQCELFDALLDGLDNDEFLINEVIEIELEDGSAIVTRYELRTIPPSVDFSCRIILCYSACSLPPMFASNRDPTMPLIL